LHDKSIVFGSKFGAVDAPNGAALLLEPFGQTIQGEAGFTGLGAFPPEYTEFSAKNRKTAPQPEWPEWPR
jgi:hypothetical protein